MDINTCDKYNLECLTLEKPKKIEDVYVSNINFILQTPKLTITKLSKKISLLLNESIEKLINSFDDTVIKLISNNSTEFFEESLSIEDAEEIYKNSIKNIKNKTTLCVSINKKINIYNKKKEQLELNELSVGDTVICLLKCKKIIFYKNYCEPHWEVVQIKLKEKEKEKEISIDTSKYLLIEDPNDTYEGDNSDNDDSEEIKKIKIKE